MKANDISKDYRANFFSLPLHIKTLLDNGNDDRVVIDFTCAGITHKTIVQ